MKVTLTLALLLICAGCSVLNFNTVQYPKASEKANTVINLQSNIEKTAFYIDNKLIATGRRVKVMIDDRQEHTIKTVPEGYIAKEEFIQPPYRDGFLLSFTYMMGDKDDLTETHKELQNKAVVSEIDSMPRVVLKKDIRKKAIVIGIENYRQKLPKADYATSDADTVTMYLTKVLGYHEENVITLTNDQALKSDFDKYFEQWLKNNVENDSKVLVYYSGHGSPNPKTGDAYLVPYDGDPTFIDSTGYSLKRLYEVLGKLPAKEIIVLLDSCFSGAGGKSVLAEGARPLVMNGDKNIRLPKNVIVLSAAKGDQISTTYKEKGHGLFTYFLLKSIKDTLDLNDINKLSLGELYSLIKPQIELTARKKNNAEQSPQLIIGDKTAKGLGFK